MHRVRLLATVVALLSSISFSAEALISGGHASRDAGSMPGGKPADTAKTSLSPDRKPVRVISLSPSDSSTAATAPASPPMPQLTLPQPSPSMAQPVVAQEAPAAETQAVGAPAKPAIHMAASSQPARKRSAAAPARMRAAAGRAEKPFIVSGLF
jgi:hypothetical protein